MRKIVTESKGYSELFQGIVTVIKLSRIEAASSANEIIGEMYFNIGKMITEKQDAYGWGKSIVEKLSVDLSNLLDGREGYSPQNLWYMRQFYQEYKDYPELHKLTLSVPWGQNILVFSKIKDINEREYYLKAIAGNG